MGGFDEKLMEKYMHEICCNDVELKQKIGCFEELVGRYMFAKDKTIYTEEYKEQLINILEIVNSGDFYIFNEEYDEIELLEKEILQTQGYDISQMNYYWP